MRETVLALLTVLAAACASPDGAFRPIGKPVMPLYQARAHCKEDSRSISSEGTVSIDWDAYERCMEDLGWLKQSSSGSAGPGSTGGGGPAY
jgi:hypothetical protein